MNKTIGGLRVEVTADTTKLQTGMKKAEKSIQNLSNQSARLSSATKNTTGSLNNIGRGAGQASIQLQQFIGQVSGGVNPLIAFSQQGADLGIVLGAPLLGSVVGISAALGTMLLPNVFNSKTALEELEQTTENLHKTLTISASGVADFSEQIETLANRSEFLAKVQIASGIAEAAKQIKVASKEINENITGLSQGTFKRFNEAVEASGITMEGFASGAEKITVSAGFSFEQINTLNNSITRLTEKFGISRQQAISLASAFSTFRNNQNADGVDALEGALGGLNNETDFANEKLIKLTSTLQPYFEAILQGEKYTGDLKSALEDINAVITDETVTTEKYDNIKNVSKSLNQQLAIMNAEIQMGDVYAQQLATAFELGLTSVEQLDPEIRKTILSINELQAAQEAQAAAEQQAIKDAAQAKRDAAKEIEAEDRDFEAFSKSIDQQIELEKRAEEAKAANQAKANQTFIDGLISRNESELEAIESKRLAELDMLANFNQQELDQLGGFEAAKTQIEADATAARMALAEREKQAKLGALSSTFGNLSSLMNTGSKKLFEIGKKAAKAGAIVDGYAAISKTMASVPYPFNIPLAAAQAVASAVQVRNINAQQFGGAGGGASSFVGGLPSINTNEGGQQAQATPQRNVSINLQGSMFNADQVRTLIGQINEQIGDGVSIATGG